LGVYLSSSHQVGGTITIADPRTTGNTDGEGWSVSDSLDKQNAEKKEVETESGMVDRHWDKRRDAMKQGTRAMMIEALLSSMYLTEQNS